MLTDLRSFPSRTSGGSLYITIRLESYSVLVCSSRLLRHAGCCDDSECSEKPSDNSAISSKLGLVSDFSKPSTMPYSSSKILDFNLNTKLSGRSFIGGTVHELNTLAWVGRVRKLLNALSSYYKENRFSCCNPSSRKYCTHWFAGSASVQRARATGFWRGQIRASPAISEIAFF